MLICGKIKASAVVCVQLISENDKINRTLNGGSLGFWIDEERSKIRVDM